MRQWILAAAVSVLAVGSASAQTMDQPTTGFYLRGEVGYGWTRGAGLTDNSAPTSSVCVICSSTQLNNLGSGAELGGGVGYRINDWLRAEATIAYRGWYQLSATDPDGFSYKSDVKSLVGMANLLVDPPVKLGPLQPYLGAGIGIAHNTMGTISQNAYFPSVGIGASESDPGGSSNNFAWQLMAGLAWPLTSTLTAELGYRYLDAGKIQTSAGTSQFSIYGGGINFTTPVTTTGVKGNLAVNEVVLALRWAF